MLCDAYGHLHRFAVVTPVPPRARRAFYCSPNYVYLLSPTRQVRSVLWVGRSLIVVTDEAIAVCFPHANPVPLIVLSSLLKLAHRFQYGINTFISYYFSLF